MIFIAPAPAALVRGVLADFAVILDPFCRLQHRWSGNCKIHVRNPSGGTMSIHWFGYVGTPRDRCVSTQITPSFVTSVRGLLWRHVIWVVAAVLLLTYAILTRDQSSWRFKLQVRATGPHLLILKAVWHNLCEPGGSARVRLRLTRLCWPCELVEQQRVFHSPRARESSPVPVHAVTPRSGSKPVEASDAGQMRFPTETCTGSSF